MVNTKSNLPSVIINWIARILGLIVVVVFLIFVIGDVVDTITQGYGFEVESLKIILPIVLALAGFILGWWHKIIGGSILILVAIIFGILIPLDAGSNIGPESDFHAVEGWLILGLPFLVIGALFLISAYLGRKTSS